MPNKLFDSLCVNTPVVVSKRCISLARFVKKNQCGIIIESNDVGSALSEINKAWEEYDRFVERIRRDQHLYIWDEDKEENFSKWVLEGTEGK